MANDTMSSGRSAPETISRLALGRVHSLGDLYDATREQFCGVSIFHKPLPADSPAITRTPTPQCNISFTMANSLEKKLKDLNISGEMKLSILSGQFEVGGSAKYLRVEKKSSKSVESTLMYTIKTVKDHLELSYKEVQDYISQEATRYSGAIYVVIGIEWGAKCVIKVTDKNRKNNNKLEVRGNLRSQLENLKALANLTGEAAAGLKKSMAKKWKKFSLKIFGDFIPDGANEFPLTLDNALEWMKKVQEVFQGDSDEKGRPLSYVMLPLSYIYPDRPPVQIVPLEAWGVRLVHLFDRITELRQKVYDRFEELSNYRHGVTASELEDLRDIKEGLEALQAEANNNNNNLIYIAPACRMTSEALADSSSRATECLTEK